MSRRRFMKIAGISAVGASSLGYLSIRTKGVSLVRDPDDAIANSPPSRWAATELEESLTSQGIPVARCSALSQAGSGDLVIVAAGTDTSPARRLLQVAKATVPAAPEALGLIPVVSDDRHVLMACGHDVRGLVYALLELADRVRHSDHPLDSLRIHTPVIERPANVIRSLNRLFVSEIEDKPWFSDRDMWKRYLTMIATQRFNRFNLSFGIGYDFLQHVTDAYFLFAYPFLLSVPGYHVRVPQLSDEERDNNLSTLRFISEQTAARGMHFQLGIWMHAYEWIESPHANYTIEGLTHENHAPYCRDAIRRLLQACPAIGGVTIRTHGESGVREGSYEFWRTVFDGVASCGRKVEIDLHSKGLDARMIDSAVATGLPVTVSPKYWAEHLGMPYHQADIRAYDIPKPNAHATGLMNLSTGSRSFTRYGYADLLREDRQYGVLFRIWPGTQRLLLWGDPEWSAAHSKAFGFCGSAGAELMEPLSFKGRRGSGIPGNRCAYLDSSLKPRWDWQKYLYSLRVFGRLAYNPDTAPDVWRRSLKKEFGAGAEAVESALAGASRILPIVLTTHGLSAANDHYWPEIYTNLSISVPDSDDFFFDTPSPKVFGNVSPMDPQLFLRINDFVEELFRQERSGKYTPIEYAQWIEDCADQAADRLAQAQARIGSAQSPEFRRMAIDVAIQAGLGRFFGAKFRSAVLYAIFAQSGDRTALKLSLQAYRKARSHWAGLANRARDVYEPDITVGEAAVVRGHWLDRLPAIDKDIEAMATILQQTPESPNIQSESVRSAIHEALGRPARTPAPCRHTPEARFTAGKALDIDLSVEKPLRSARLYYRHVNHAERYETLNMQRKGKGYRATVPAEYTATEYPLEYYFEIKEVSDRVWLYPGFGAALSNQPYFVVRKA